MYGFLQLAGAALLCSGRAVPSIHRAPTCAPRRPELFHPFLRSCQPPYLKTICTPPHRRPAFALACGIFRPFRMKSETLVQYAKKLTKFSSAKQNFCIASRKMNTYTIGEAGTTDSDCHFSLFGQGRSPPRTRLRPSNKRRFFNEGQEIQRIGFCRQHLQVRWQSSGRKGHSVWLTARAGDVRRERHAGHADCRRRGL